MMMNPMNGTQGGAGAAGGVIEVRFGSLDRGSQGIARTFKDLQALYGQLQDHVNPVLNTWDGSSRDAYKKVQDQWNKLNDEMNQALQSIGTGVDTANKNFRRAEQIAASAWG
jgi:WXG100 family type VII secretion target